MATRRLKPFDSVSILCSSTEFELRLLDRGGHAALGLGAIEAADLRNEVEECKGSHVAVAGRALRQVAELRFRQPRVLEHVHAGDAGAAGVGLQEAGEHLHGRRLAGAVGAEKAQHLALLHAERDAIDGDDLAEPLLEVVSLDQDRHSYLSSIGLPAAAPR